MAGWHGGTGAGAGVARNPLMMYSISLWPGKECMRLVMAAESMDDPKPTASVPTAAAVSEGSCFCVAQISTHPAR